MRYAILGPLEVVDDAGARLELGTPRQRAVLAILIVHANRVVSLDRLIDELWGDAAPSAATASLQAYISNLRKVLEPQRAARAKATVLVSEPPGYVLRCEPDAVDAVAFEQQCAEARALLATDPARARAGFEQALGLWRGAALADFAYEPFATEEIARLEELRASAEEDLVDARLALGDVGLAVAALERLVADQPLRERRRAQQMLALYRAGRQAEALRAYDDARAEFARELAIEPSPALQRLYQQILDHEPELGAPAPRAVTLETLDEEIDEIDDDEVEEEAGDVPHDEVVQGKPFVGRDVELRQLLDVALDPAATSTRLAVVTGTAGIGKTRLLEELAGELGRRGWLVAWGRCHDDEGAPPLWPWMQSLRPLLADRTADLSDAERADLAALLPEFGGGADELADAETARFRQFDAVTRVLERVAGAQPVLVILDDLHWADASSLRLLRFVATYARSPAVMLAVTAREREGDRPDALLDAIGDLARQPGCLRLALGPLSPAAVEAYVYEAGHDVPRDVLAGLHARTEGNPFFVSELVKLLVSEAPHRAGLGEIPVAVGDVIRRRVARLPGPTQELLKVAAVCGREFDVDDVAAVCALDIETALDQLDPALVTGVIADTDTGTFRFAHALLSETLEADLTAVTRAKLHLQLAHVIIDRAHDLDEHLSEIGRHLEGAGALADPAEVIRYAQRAAELATQRVALEEAVIERERVVAAIARMPDADARARLDALVALGRARLRAGDLAGARALQTDMLALAAQLDVETLARTALAYDTLAATQWRSWGVVSQPMLAALERVLAELPPDDSALRARALCALAVELYYDDARRTEGIDLARAGMEMAERLGDAALLAQTLNAVVVSGKIPDALSTQLDAAHRLVALDPAKVSADMLAAGRAHLLRLSLHAGAIDDFPGAVAAAVDEAEARRDPTIRTLLAWAEASAAFFDGDLVRTEAKAHEAAARHQRTGAWGSIEALGLHLELAYRESGRLAEIDALLQRMIDDMAPPGMRLLSALVAVGMGALDEARARFALAPATVPFDYAWLTYKANRAYIAAAIDDPECADLYARLLPYRNHVVVLDGSFACYGSVEYYLGLLAPDGEASEHFARANVVHDRIGAKPWAARSRLAWARVDPERRERLLDEVDAIIAATQLDVIRVEAETLRGAD